jgi:hypothetical protein
MPIRDYTERKIRKSILAKTDGSPVKGRSKHQKVKIFLDDKLLSVVKVPNDHDKVMKHGKTSKIAQALRLTDAEFEGLIDCSLTGPAYYSLLRGKFSQ